ncbi:MAG TPA: DUF4893 domain-containing protein [Rhizomicrobium sp.]|jgi:hypothetical protein|nr:DUF4893 domain-containing protein [Rhizomicrobium sp.]
MGKGPLLKLAAALIVCATPALAGWQDRASSYDAERLSRLDEARAKGMQEAQGASEKDLAAARAVLNRNSRAVSLASLKGTWRCRTIKLGGMAPMVIYDWFTCRIGEEHGHPYFEKQTGTQHFGGSLYPHESGGFVFLGGTNWSKDEQAFYSSERTSLGAETTPSDAVGLLSSIGPNVARIEFPYPAQESTFDVIELRR